MTALRNHAQSASKRKSSIGALSAAAVLLLVIAAGSLGWAVWQLRVDARRDAFEETGNLALVLAGQLSRFLQTIDVVLAETRDEFLHLDSHDAEAWRRSVVSPAMQEKLKAKLARVPQAFNIAMADAGGQVLLSTASWPAPAISVADRDYFRGARAQERDELAISSPIRNRVNGEVTVVFARSLKDAKGEFIGVVYISVNRKYFEIIYDSIKSVRDLTFILALTNGTILVRHPQQTDVSGQRMPSTSAWYDAMAQGGGSFVTPGAFGGQARLASARSLQGFPLAVSVSTSVDVALARWRVQAIVLGLGGFVFVACSLFLLLVAGYEMRSLATSEASLRDKSESLERLIAERAEMAKRLVQLQKIAAPALAPADDPVPVRKHKTILVVDDDDLVRESVITQINALGYGTIEASGPAEALEIIASPEAFDLLFSDIVMPGPIDGVELAQLARARRPGLKVMLSSGFPDLKSGRSSKDSCEQWQILKKPYRRGELQDALQGILGEDEPQPTVSAS